jgi:xanthine/uracil permease
MYGGLIAAPLVVGTAIGLNAAEIALLITASILVGGLATLLQTLGVKWFGAKLPIVQGIICCRGKYDCDWYYRR